MRATLVVGSSQTKDTLLKKNTSEEKTTRAPKNQKQTSVFSAGKKLIFQLNNNLVTDPKIYVKSSFLPNSVRMERKKCYLSNQS